MSAEYPTFVYISLSSNATDKYFL